MSAPVVIKIGGNEVDDPQWLQALAGRIAHLGRTVVLVHGGGKEVSELQRTLGAEPRWVDGLRETTPETLRVVSMVLSGLVNKRLVAALIGAGVDAVGISGEDGGLLRAEMLRGGALGRTGAIVQVRTDLLRALLTLGVTVVVSPVSRGLDGGALNVNADDAAAAIAAALGAEELLFVSNISGVKSGGEVLQAVAPEGVEELIASGIASGGMAPKLRAAAVAARGGVTTVRIGGLEMLTDPEAGTGVGSLVGGAASG